MVEEQSSSSESEHEINAPDQDVPEEWFKVACYLASRGKQEEALLALKSCFKLREDYPIAWAIKSAVLLSQGSETEAEKAGKKAISLSPKLKLSWPKMRSIIRDHGILRGKGWRDPQKVVIETTSSTEWGKLLDALGKESLLQLDESNVTQEIPKVIEESPEVDTSPTSDIVEETAEKSIEIENPKILFKAADSLLKQGELKKAEEALIKGLEIDPENGEAWLSLSSLRMGRHKYDEAIQSLKSATDKMPTSSAAWYQLGYCYQKLNKYRQSLQPIRNALKIDQNNSDYWMALGYSEFHLGTYDAAARSLLRAIRISPNHKDALYYLALTMERKGNTKHALSLYLKLLNFEGLTHTMLQRLSSAFERLNRPREAREARARAEHVRQTVIQ